MEWNGIWNEMKYGMQWNGIWNRMEWNKIWNGMELKGMEWKMEYKGIK